MSKNKAIKKEMEKSCGIRLRELCEVLNSPEYRRKDFRLGITISEVAESVGKQPNFIINEIRLKRLKPTFFRKRVKISHSDLQNWLMIGEK